MRKPIAVDLFAGCGGLTQGLKDAGFEIVGAVELDSIAAESYRVNHRSVKMWESDIRNIDANNMAIELNLKPGQLDLLAGCPPCQGFSTIRTRNGAVQVEDIRNDLIDDFLRFIKVLRPKTFMMENVPGLLKDKRIDRFIEDIEKLGYEFNAKVLDAANYAVPQRRRRMVFLGAQGGQIGFAKYLSEKRFVRHAIENLPRAGSSGDFLHDIPSRHSPRIIELISLIPKDGGSRRDLPQRLHLECHKKAAGFEDVYGRMAWDKVAPTITGGCITPSKGRYLHPEENRSITLREAALLQSFPPNYYISLKKGKHKAASLIGNAWPPAFITPIALKVKSHLG